MEKELLIPVLCLLLILSFSMIPMPTIGSSPTEVVSLDFDIAVHDFIELDETEATEGGSGFGKLPFWVDMVDAESVGQTGEDIYVAVLDTGLAPFWSYYFPAERIKAEWGIGFTHDVWWNETIGGWEFGPLKTRDFITGPRGSGHGTHVTSTIIGFNYAVGVTPEKGTFPTPLFYVRGVAPKATIIPVLVLDAWYVYHPPSGTWRLLTGGTFEMVAAGIRYVADLAEEKGVKIIINMSLGAGIPDPLIEDAINYAISKGVIIVAAAGNNGEAGMGWPGAYPQVISCAAGGWTMQWIGSGTSDPPSPYRWWLSDVPEKFNTEDMLGNDWQHYLIDWSSRANRDLGQFWRDLDVCTPGMWVVGPYKPYTTAAVYSYRYYYVAGTSMSAPHASGIAALVLQRYRDLDQFSMEFIVTLASCSLPMPRDEETGGVIVWSSSTGPWAYYTWNDHDYGSGFLQADEALFAAFVYTRLIERLVP